MMLNIGLSYSCGGGEPTCTVRPNPGCLRIYFSLRATSRIDCKPVKTRDSILIINEILRLFSLNNVRCLQCEGIMLEILVVEDICKHSRTKRRLHIELLRSSWDLKIRLLASLLTFCLDPLAIDWRSQASVILQIP